MPIWLDNVHTHKPESWSADFLLPEAKEVLAAIGAFVLCFQKPVTQEDYAAIKGMMREVAKVVKEGFGGFEGAFDGVCLAVALKQDVVPHLEISEEEWEELGMELGFEVVDGEGKGKNEFGGWLSDISYFPVLFVSLNPSLSSLILSLHGCFLENFTSYMIGTLGYTSSH